MIVLSSTKNKKIMEFFEEEFMAEEVSYFEGLDDGITSIKKNKPELVVIDTSENSINGSDFLVRVSELLLFSNTTYVFTHTNSLSIQEKENLRTLGYEEVIDISHGIENLSRVVSNLTKNTKVNVA